MSGSRKSYRRRAHATATVNNQMTDAEFAKMEAEVDPKAKKNFESLVGKGHKRNQKCNHYDAEDKELKFRRINTTTSPRPHMPRAGGGGRGGGGRGGGGRSRGGRGPNAGVIAGRGLGAEQSVKVFKKMSPKLAEFVKKVKAYTFYALTNVQGNLLDMAYDDEMLQDEALYGLSQVGLGHNGALGPRIAGKNADILAALADAA